ncbi:MAG: hypothetical protein ACHQ0J_12485 [Candidatus Dormibacterales bacterium]
MRLRKTLILAAAALALTCCSNSAQLFTAVPADGVQVTGAVIAFYPVGQRVKCLLTYGQSAQELQVITYLEAGDSYLAALVANFTGTGTYSDVRWPPQAGHSSVYVWVAGRQWDADSGTITVSSFGQGTASGTILAGDLRKDAGTPPVNVAGSWSCPLGQLIEPPPDPTLAPSPSASPSSEPPLPPYTQGLPVGTPVARRILPPAKVLPAVPLCAAPVRQDQDGNADPLFCSNGAIIVAAWMYFVPVDPNLLGVGPNPSIIAVVAAICADGPLHPTNPMVQSGYELAAAYYGWHFAFDLENFLLHSSCP